MTPLKRLHIIGRKNHGKTTLVAELVRELTSRGLRVGAIKHTHHRHELDTPGKDSHTHRTAGAAVVGILSPGMTAVFVPQSSPPGDSADRYAPMAPMMSLCELILVEGDSQTDAPKIEVWRAEVGSAPIAAEDPRVLALVTDDEPPVAAPRLPRGDLAGVADWILAYLQIGGEPSSQEGRLT